MGWVWEGGVSESELLADVSEAFGVGRVRVGGVRDGWLLMGGSRTFREEGRCLGGSEEVLEPWLVMEAWSE